MTGLGFSFFISSGYRLWSEPSATAAPLLAREREKGWAGVKESNNRLGCELSATAAPS